MALLVGVDVGTSSTKAVLYDSKRGSVVATMSLLETLCYSLRQNVDLLEEELGRPIGEVIAIGGATRSPLWMALKSAVTGRPVRVPGLAEATAVGAALLAGMGAGVFADSAAVAASVRRRDDVLQPEPATAADYARRYDHFYRPLYPLLREINHKLAKDGDPAR